MVAVELSDIISVSITDSYYIEWIVMQVSCKIKGIKIHWFDYVHCNSKD